MPAASMPVFYVPPVAVAAAGAPAGVPVVFNDEDQTEELQPSQSDTSAGGQTPYPDSRAVVAGRKVFSCPTPGCKYKTYRPHHLKRHILTHTGEKPFECNMCDVKCARADALIQHRKTHVHDHPFMCPHCTVELQDEDEFQDHLKTHIHRCQTCNENFSTLKRLRDHERKHSRFTCRFCGLSSIHVKKVERHERSTHGALANGVTKFTFPMDLRKASPSPEKSAKRRTKRIQTTKMTKSMSEPLVPPGIVAPKAPNPPNENKPPKEAAVVPVRIATCDFESSSGYESDQSRASTINSQTTSLQSPTTVRNSVSTSVDVERAVDRVLDLSEKSRRTRRNSSLAVNSLDFVERHSSVMDDDVEMSGPLDLSAHEKSIKSPRYELNEAYNLTTIKTFIERCANDASSSNGHF